MKIVREYHVIDTCGKSHRVVAYLGRISATEEMHNEIEERFLRYWERRDRCNAIMVEAATHSAPLHYGLELVLRNGQHEFIVMNSTMSTKFEIMTDNVSDPPPWEKKGFYLAVKNGWEI